jgi:CubicO group peptidase (beta-lactamase class C family)
MTTSEHVARDIRLPSALPFAAESPVALPALMERFSIPGISVAVVAGGSLAWAEGWGVCDASRGDPVTPRTLFQAGSISKPVAAMCALRLVAAGKLKLDTDVNDVLTGWQVPANLGWQPRVTLRQLLSHTAGLTVHGFPGYPSGGPVPTLVEVLDGEGNTPPVRVSTIPGLQFSYSGGGYCVLQQLLMAATGKPFPELARELVLDPLEMNGSTYEQPLPELLQPQASSGHREAGSPVNGRWHVYPEMAAAGLWTTPTDLARFLIGFQQAAAGAPGAILPRQLADEALRPHAPNASYGLGMQLERLEQTRVFGHGGDDQGFTAWMGAYAELGAGAVVMTNSDRGALLIDPVRQAMARAHGWPEASTAAPDGEPLVSGDRYAGAYETADGRELRIDQDATGLLLLVTPGQEPIELFSGGDCEYVARAAKVTVTFECDDGGMPHRLVLRQDAAYVQDIVALRPGSPE